jgi:hypothetical protein
MPRIRTLKPELHAHRKVGALTDRQFRLWVGLITQADDDGRFVAEAAQLRATLFSYHPKVSIAHITSDLNALAAVGLIELYAAQNTQYGWFPSWRDHQVINRPTPSKLPLPPSLNDHGAFREDSRSAHAGSEGIGSEGIGTEGIRGEGSQRPTHLLERSRHGHDDDWATIPPGRVSLR